MDELWESGGRGNPKYHMQTFFVKTSCFFESQPNILCQLLIRSILNCIFINMDKFFQQSNHVLLKVMKNRFLSSWRGVYRLRLGFELFLHSFTFADFFYEQKLMSLVVVMDKGPIIQKLFHRIFGELVDGCRVIFELY